MNTFLSSLWTTLFESPAFKMNSPYPFLPISCTQAFSIYCHWGLQHLVQDQENQTSPVSLYYLQPNLPTSLHSKQPCMHFQARHSAVWALSSTLFLQSHFLHLTHIGTFSFQILELRHLFSLVGGLSLLTRWHLDYFAAFLVLNTTIFPGVFVVWKWSRKNSYYPIFHRNKFVHNDVPQLSLAHFPHLISSHIDDHIYPFVNIYCPSSLEFWSHLLHTPVCFLLTVYYFHLFFISIKMSVAGHTVEVKTDV